MNDEDAKERLLEEAKSLAQVIQRQLYVLVFTGFFLVLTLAGPDERLVRADATISWPLIQTQIPLATFLTFAPIALIALLIYLHLFVGRLAELIRRDVEMPQSFIFSMSSPFAKGASDLLLYALVPTILGYFTWKVVFREEAVLLASVTAAVALGCAVVYAARAHRDGEAVRRGAGRAAVALVLIATAAGVVSAASGGHERLLRLRSVDLLRADLGVSDEFPRVNLLGQNLSYADLQFARLVGADLRNATLNHADLTSTTTYVEPAVGQASAANFGGASLIGARLHRADLRGSDFTCAKLRGAELNQALLGNTWFRSAELDGADFTKAEMAEDEEGELVFQEAVLIGARFSNAQLPATNFANADLQRAEFDGATMEGAVFNLANLSGAKLNDGSFSGAKFRGAVLNGADFRYSDLTGTSFTGANLEDARFDFSYGIDAESAFRGARLCRTRLADGSQRDDGCSRSHKGFVRASVCESPTSRDARPDRVVKDAPRQEARLQER